jgi:fructuronate reductase/mannitol 2-dehydrogenase
VPALDPFSLLLDTDTPLPLNSSSFGLLADVADVPLYDRSSLTPSVVHIGVGGFHRAHQAVYLDDLARRGISTDWGVVGVGLHRPEMREVLTEQDNLYTVVVREAEHDDLRVIGVITRYLFAPDDPAAVLDVLADEGTRLVTLTITGASYPAGGEVDPADPDVVRDVEHPEAPGTAFGYLVEALDRRRRAGLPPFTVLSCDNMQHNGAAARAAVLSTARLRDPSLAAWVEAHGAFPSSMVDRITPETTPEVRDAVAQRHGLGDRWPVVTEPFSQWIIEDSFVGGRPPLEQVGVQFVRDVRPHEIMKTRMLNGAHSALGYLSYLAGYRTTDEAMADPVVSRYVAGYLQEASAGLLSVVGIDLEEYTRSLMARFANPRISDQLTRLCRRGSVKVPSYVLPALQVALDQDRPRGHLVLALAAWLRYLRGEDYAGSPITIEDVRAEQLQPLAAASGTDPRSLLTQHEVFGGLGEDARLTAEVEAALRSLEEGPLEAAARLAASGESSRGRVA